MSMLSSSLRHSHYGRVFKLLLSTGPAARHAFVNVVGNVIAREVSRYCRQPSQKFPTFTGSESVQSFTWNNMITELRQSVPTLYAAVSSSMPKKLRKNNDELEYALQYFVYTNLVLIFNYIYLLFYGTSTIVNNIDVENSCVFLILIPPASEDIQKAKVCCNNIYQFKHSWLCIAAVECFFFASLTVQVLNDNMSVNF